MKNVFKRIGAAAALVAAATSGLAQTEPTALDEWMLIDDGSYRYEAVSAQKIDGVKVYQIHMVSQQWLDPSRVDRVEWEHWMTVCVPEVIKDDTGLIFIGGGRNRDETPSNRNDEMIRIAGETGAVAAELGQVPNQPLVFEGKSGPLTEDALIAYAWNKYLQTGDATWLPRLPMTKSAVKAMDTVTSFILSESSGRHEVKNFIVAGGSKRGWTTWTTGVVDKRVIGIVPIVIDVLNVIPSMEHHWEAYGFYAPALEDYERSSIMQWRESREFQSLLSVVEPYSYRHRLTLPKLILNASGDEFFVPDSWRFYWKDLIGDKYIRYVPNADHSLRDTDAINTLVAFFHAVSNDVTIPTIQWDTVEGGQVRAELSAKPAKALLWTATNPEARDFRVESLGKVWKSTPIEPVEDLVYISAVSEPSSGWTAFLLEFTFDIPGSPAPLKLSTGTHVVPDFLPFDFDTGEPRPRPADF